MAETNIIRCPHCGESYYQKLYSSSTCLGWIPIYRNGELINKDPNVTSVHCHCLECDEDFSYKE